MYKSKSGFMQRTGIRSYSPKKKYLPLTGQIIQFCVQCNHYQLKKNVENCPHCGKKVIDKYAHEIGNNIFKMIKYIRSELYLFQKQNNKQLIRFNDFILSIYPKNLRKIDIFKKNLPTINLYYIPANIVMRIVLTRDELMSPNIVRKSIRKYCLNFFDEITKLTVSNK